MWLLPSYLVLIRVLENSSERYNFGEVPLKVYTSFFSGPWFLRLGLIPTNRILTNSTSSLPENSLALTEGLTDDWKYCRKDKGSLSLQAFPQQGAGKRPAYLQAPVLTSCSILQSSQDIKIVIHICIWNF